ncbi:50S ribosomal protein L20 [bacterium]|nr:50S ribosomal protein L20 [bacterium]
MTRVKRSVAGRLKRKKIFKLAKGYKGVRGNLYRAAKEAVFHAWQYAYVGRKLKKRDIRRLWIARINAAVRERGLNYSSFMRGIKSSDIALNRKVLSELAIHHPDIFDSLTEIAKSNIS